MQLIIILIITFRNKKVSAYFESYQKKHHIITFSPDHSIPELLQPLIEKLMRL